MVTSSLRLCPSFINTIKDITLTKRATDLTRRERHFPIFYLFITTKKSPTSDNAYLLGKNCSRSFYQQKPNSVSTQLRRHKQMETGQRALKQKLTSANKPGGSALMLTSLLQRQRRCLQRYNMTGKTPVKSSSALREQP